MCQSLGLERYPEKCSELLETMDILQLARITGSDWEILARIREHTSDPDMLFSLFVYLLRRQKQMLVALLLKYVTTEALMTMYIDSILYSPALLENKVVTELQARGLLPTSPNEVSKLTLEIAFDSNNESLVDIMIRRVELTNTEFQRYLEIAIDSNNEFLFDIMIRRVELTNTEFQRYAHRAMLRGNREMAEVLEDMRQIQQANQNLFEAVLTRNIARARAVLQGYPRPTQLMPSLALAATQNNWPMVVEIASYLQGVEDLNSLLLLMASQGNSEGVYHLLTLGANAYDQALAVLNPDSPQTPGILAMLNPAEAA